MTHDASSQRTTVRRARWQQHCARTTDILCASLSAHDQQHYPAAEIAYRQWYDATDPATAGVLRAKADQQFSDPLADVATAMALLYFAVSNGRLPADELASVREYFAQTSAHELVERILTNVQAVPPPLHLAG
ncbi:MAG: hypothetical protein QOF58_6581 [Pseudonocardiales bacterium]|jgi:hypothetical protein|nr:hypothetical protein [Pseudonocardiales bacterium]